MPRGKKPSARQRYIPYARGFKAPSRTQVKNAVGPDPSPEFRGDEQSFAPLPKCTSIDDWLAQYDEEGQTYNDYLLQCPWLSRRRLKYMEQKFVPSGNNLREKYPDGVIYVMPLGEFDSNGVKFDALIEYAEIFFGIPVRPLPAVPLEFESGAVYWVEVKGNGERKRHRMNARFDAGTGHYQLKVDLSLLQLRSYVPDDALCLIALTMTDLFEEKPDLFVAGMAAGNHRVAIFTLARYDPNLSFSGEFWYKQTKSSTHSDDERQRLMLLRSCRLLVHETSHLLGIAHCIYYACLMNGSGHLLEDFRQPMFLCPVDLRKLHRLCNFDVRERYRKMQSFFEKYGIKEEAAWCTKHLKNLANQESTSEDESS